MTEKEFEMYCREVFENQDFILGRKTKKDTTERAQDYFVGDNQEKNEIDGVKDISDLLDTAQSSTSFTKPLAPKTPPPPEKPVS